MATTVATKVTIVVSPRDRYSGILECVDDVYTNTTSQCFELVILDLGYPRSLIDLVKSRISGLRKGRVVTYGRMIPIDAIRKILKEIATPFVVLLDNDTRLTAGWLPPLLETAESTGAAVVSPLTFEKAGVDEGAELRNHIFTSEIRVVGVDGETYLIESKPYRRALPEDIPREVAPTQLFELHCVLFRTSALKKVELPQMVIREHIDIGMQLQAMGEKLVSDPRSVVYFDNLGTRMDMSDLGYFNFRWNRTRAEESSRLFEKRWGYKFYSEMSIYNWAIRRRLFLLGRYFHLPIGVCNKAVGLYNKVRLKLSPIWDPLKDPVGDSVIYYETLPGGIPLQKSHDIFMNGDGRGNSSAVEAAVGHDAVSR